MQAKFLLSNAPERLLRGSNQSGKTLTAAVSVARAVTGLDKRFPPKGIFFCVAKDGGRIGDVVWRALGREGAFHIIRDGNTGAWRGYRPWCDEDRARVDQRIPAPPLIPPRMVKKTAWASKAESEPTIVLLHNGWEIHFFSSLGKPPQGSKVDGCLAAWSTVYDPVRKQYRRIDTIDSTFHVLSYDDGKEVILPASKPFIKGFGEIVRAELSNGNVIHVTREHEFMARDGHMVTAERAWLDQTPLVCRDTSEFAAGATHVERMPERFRRLSLFEQSFSLRTASPIPHRAWRGVFAPTNGEDCGIACALHGTGTNRDCPADCCLSAHLRGEPFLRLEEDGLAFPPFSEGALEHSHGYLPGDVLVATPVYSRHRLRDFAVSLAGDERQTGAFLPQENPAPGQSLSSQREGDGQSRQSSSADQRTFDESLPRPRSAAVVRRERGERSQPHPASAEDTGSLFGSGASASPGFDSQRHTEAATLQRLATGETGNGAGESISPCVYVSKLEAVCHGPIWDISVPKTHNYLYGGTISSNCWFDEEIKDRDWYPEMMARIMTRGGRFVWSATPQAGTEQLYKLHERAEMEAFKKAPKIEEFLLLLDENPHVAEESKRDFAARLSEDEYRVRYEGEFVYLSFKVFPEFKVDLYASEPFSIPPSWTRYMIVDPGRQVCACLFMAVPPPEEGDHVYLYDELYLKHCSAELFAKSVAEKVAEQTFQAFIIDHRGGRQTDAGSGRTIEDQYSDALGRKKVKSVATGTGFIWGSDDKKAGVEACRDWMRIRDDGTAKLRLFQDRVPNFLAEIKRFRYKKDPEGRVTDEPEDRGEVHAMACFRYAALYKPSYVKPKLGTRAVSGAYAAYQKLKKSLQKIGESINLGPTPRG